MKLSFRVVALGTTLTGATAEGETAGVAEVPLSPAWTGLTTAGRWIGE